MKEYGGYLPLELNMGNEYYDFPENKILRTNSGLTAIYCALKKLNPERVFLPRFICPSVDKLISSMGYEIIQYSIDGEFEPLNLESGVGDCLILVNYFGINTKIIKKYYSKFDNVIIDNTEAFFANPILCEGVYNVYSCRKFIGTPDGGYLIGDELMDFNLNQDYSSKRSDFLLLQYEYGTNSAYKDYIENYEQVKNKRKYMSEFTKRILCSADYSEIKKKRVKNFRELDRLIGEKNELRLNLSEEDIPYSYPFMLRCDIRSKLIESKIYVPWIWREKKDDEALNENERDFINYIYHLPIDQRYDEKDMKSIAQVVFELMEDMR